MTGLVYSALKAHLTTAMPTAYVDWYFGQYIESEMEGGGELLYTTPAIFVEFAPIEWVTLPGSIQRTVLRFSVHLVNESMYATDKRFVGDPALDHLGQESQVFRALMNRRFMLSDVPSFAALAGTENDRVLVESIVRKSSESDHVMHRQLVSIQSFEATVYDYSAQPTWATVLAALQLEIQKVDHL